MVSKPIAKRSIPCPLGTCRGDQWCLHAVQAELAADSNGAPVVRATPIVVANVGEGEELLEHPPGSALQRLFEGGRALEELGHRSRIVRDVPV